MKRDVQKSLNEAVESYTYFKEKKVYGSCVVYIACVYHSIIYCPKYNKEKKWMKLIDAEALEEIFYFRAIEAHIKVYKRIKHVFSFGDYWNDDEWIFMLLDRLNLEMVKDFFHYRNLPFPDDLDLKGLCAEMKELSQTKKNKRVFESSVATMQKNSPLPFVDIWFEADHRDEYLKNK